ncbi:MurR/RpiR family transcriptional regulator [Caproiciproducens sp. NJN-50]|uniref:MurR/RpiR family transcriptional regulator n=1 Tax=Acutalibacteraceae TaxID=3082771 RepID=UPI000FFE0AA3|nr:MULTISPECIES: MurR/RpiR family transcriptional regulator [Acutalibacteraceae]QAT50056.1 MurR/RpiR family transcriptional regulator [Caproiciproducens sp. NJN-50]
MDSIIKIRDSYDRLTHKQKKIADYLLANPEDICYISLKDLSEQTASSEATILRTCKLLGFRNFIELKQSFRKHTQQLVKNLSSSRFFLEELPPFAEGDQKLLLQSICDHESEKCSDFFRNIEMDEVLKAAGLILKAQNILLFGQGISKVLTQFFEKRLSLLGINAYAIDPEEMDNAQTRLARLKKGDVCIAISFPRYYTPIRNIIQYVEEKKISVIVITDSPKSPLILQNSLNFICQTSTTMFFNSLSVPFALINLIASGVVLEMGPQYDKLVATTHEIAHCINKISYD